MLLRARKWLESAPPVRRACSDSCCRGLACHVHPSINVPNDDCLLAHWSLRLSVNGCPPRVEWSALVLCGRRSLPSPLPASVVVATAFCFSYFFFCCCCCCVLLLLLLLLLLLPPPLLYWRSCRALAAAIVITDTAWAERHSPKRDGRGTVQLVVSDRGGAVRLLSMVAFEEERESCHSTELRCVSPFELSVLVADQTESRRRGSHILPPHARSCACGPVCV